MSPEQMFQLCEFAEKSEKVAREELIMALRNAAERITDLQESFNRVKRENDALCLDLAIKEKRI